MHCSSSILQTCPRWLFPLAGVFITITSACTPTATTRVTQASTTQQVAAVPVSDIPNVPDMVTVVPFQSERGRCILIHAEVDGQAGIYDFDTGAQLIRLNRKYVRAGHNGALDTVRTSGDQNEDETQVTVHTLHIGTLFQHIDSVDVGPPTPRASNAMVGDWLFSQFSGPVLGNLGLNAMEPFEVIVDYVHQRLILIRLDADGHRLVQIPAYTPATTAPLLPRFAGINSFWGIKGYGADSLVDWIIDTGGGNFINAATVQQLGAHMTRTGDTDTLYGTGTPLGTLDHLRIGDRSVDAVKFVMPEDFVVPAMLGVQFMRQLGVAGFNFRTHQFILYH